MNERGRESRREKELERGGENVYVSVCHRRPCVCDEEKYGFYFFDQLYIQNYTENEINELKVSHTTKIRLITEGNIF